MSSSAQKHRYKIIITIAVMLTVIIYFLDLPQYLSLDFIKIHLEKFESFYQKSQILTVSIFFVTYVVIAGLGIPGAAILTLFAGALFGLFLGTIVVSFASTIGATMAFLLSRHLFRNSLRQGFPNILEKINHGMEREGAYYLFTLRLVPLFPFFALNGLMGLTTIRTSTYYWVSQLGMLAGTLVYVNAGRAISQIDSLDAIISPQILMAFALLGIFPWVAKWLTAVLSGKTSLGDTT